MRNAHLIAQVVVFSFLAPSGVLAADTDGDGVLDGVDVCCQTPAGIAVDGQGRPKGDFDLDCDVDQSDFAVFQANMTGAITPCVPATEVCDGMDNNCNCLVDDGANASCPNVANGSGVCQAGSCMFACNTGFLNCDGNPENGCEVSLAGTCQLATNLGTVRGDTGNDVVSFDGRGTRWFRVIISDTAVVAGIAARIRLTPPAGTNYDLYVYCGSSCGVPFTFTSTADSAFYSKSDFGTDETRTLIIEARYVSGEDCGDYHLEVAATPGASGNFTCP